MTRTVRRRLFLTAAAIFATVLLAGFRGLATFGEFQGAYGSLLNRVAVGERHATNVVTAVVYDYRGVDTMGEESILFGATIGVALLLRRTRGERERRFGSRAAVRSSSRSEAIEIIGLALIGPIVLLGLSVVTHGSVTPGGGFQGGAVIASAATLVFLTGGYAAFRRVDPIPMIDLAEGAGVGAYPIVGVTGLLAGSAFLANVLPLGRAGDVLSGGTLFVLNLVVGLAVAASMVLIVSELLEQTLAIRESR